MHQLFFLQSWIIRPFDTGSGYPARCVFIIFSFFYTMRLFILSVRSCHIAGRADDLILEAPPSRLSSRLHSPLSELPQSSYASTYPHK